nr:hypothetical protein Q903MT_gene296 [Picea sitchensis]
MIMMASLSTPLLLGYFINGIDPIFSPPTRTYLDRIQSHSGLSSSISSGLRGSVVDLRSG